jgi:hypothetical protein
MRIILATIAAFVLAQTAFAQSPSGTGNAATPTPGGTGQVTIPSGQNSGAGIPGQPGNKSGRAARSPSATTGAGTDSNRSQNEGIREQDAAKIPGLPGSKSGPAAKNPAQSGTTGEGGMGSNPNPNNLPVQRDDNRLSPSR